MSTGIEWLSGIWVGLCDIGNVILAPPLSPPPAGIPQCIIPKSPSLISLRVQQDSPRVQQYSLHPYRQSTIVPLKKTHGHIMSELAQLLQPKDEWTMTVGLKHDLRSIKGIMLLCYRGNHMDYYGADGCQRGYTTSTLNSCTSRPDI